MNKIKIFGWFLIGVFTMSFGMSFIKPSCFLCDIERYIVLLAAICCLMARIIWAKLFFISLFFVSSYHVAIQYKLLQAPKVCNVKVLGAKRASCGDKTMQILSIPMPVYVVLLSLLGFGVIWKKR